MKAPRLAGGTSALLALTSDLLLHPACAIREQALDALVDGAAGSSGSRLGSGANDADAPSLAQALGCGDHAEAIRILAARARLPVAAIQQAVRMRDARMLVSICWRAGCDAAETFAVETQLGRISPDDALQVGPGPRWPVTVVAMEWSLGVLLEML